MFKTSTDSFVFADPARNYGRGERKAPQLHELDLQSLPHVRLPPAESNRTQPAVGYTSGDGPHGEAPFEIHHGGRWRFSVERLEPNERPDPAFRHFYPTDTGTFMLDDLGHAKGFGPIQGAVLRYDLAGRLVAKVGLDYRLYRWGIHPRGRGLITMSADCVVHAYDESLLPLFEAPLRNTPEIDAVRRRCSIMEVALKNHLRCVALSHDHRRYLFTAVDEAWCCDLYGNRIWGVRFPLQEGWKRVAGPACAMNSEIDRAFALMNLSHPAAPEQVRRRYRELAMKWHPDHNPGNPTADGRMKALNSAVELLAENLSAYRAESIVKDPPPAQWEVGGVKFSVNFNFGQSNPFARDWIYAASFADCSNSAYLASYGGHVVVVDEEGQGLRVYDLGDVPRRVVDTGDYLYIASTNRVYVLRGGDALSAVLDTSLGEPVLTSSGLGLLEKKRICWFDESGAFLSELASKDPIRRVYRTTHGMVVETRQHRAVISGLPGW